MIDYYLEVYFFVVGKGLLCLITTTSKETNEVNKILRTKLSYSTLSKISVQDYIRTLESTLKELKEIKDNDFPEINFSIRDTKVFTKFYQNKALQDFFDSYPGECSFDKIEEAMNCTLFEKLTQSILINNQTLYDFIDYNSICNKEIKNTLQDYIDNFNSVLKDKDRKSTISAPTLKENIENNIELFRSVEPTIDLILNALANDNDNDININKELENLVLHKIEKKVLIKNKKDIEKNSINWNFFLMILSTLDDELKRDRQIKICLLLLYFFPLNLNTIRTLTVPQIKSLFSDEYLCLIKKKYFIPLDLKNYLNKLNYSEYFMFTNNEDYFFLSQKKSVYHPKSFVNLINNYLFEICASTNQRFTLKSMDLYRKKE